ncbi:Hypothetical predicted protein [Podarcis lilfordi]|uniref:Uncharacterized protein n=1 Tax=Podarcis lilfordi TaxID=74358 RepID=A0AA35KAZ8_9SAUR|nr:Hypothetical predicted protein [Podarcis lilfordi]
MCRVSDLTHSRGSYELTREWGSHQKAPTGSPGPQNAQSEVSFGGPRHSCSLPLLHCTGALSAERAPICHYREINQSRAALSSK